MTHYLALSSAASVCALMLSLAVGLLLALAGRRIKQSELRRASRRDPYADPFGDMPTPRKRKDAA